MAEANVESRYDATCLIDDKPHMDAMDFSNHNFFGLAPKLPYCNSLLILRRHNHEDRTKLVRAKGIFES